jgi:hypothetical protein
METLIPFSAMPVEPIVINQLDTWVRFFNTAMSNVEYRQSLVKVTRNNAHQLEVWSFEMLMPRKLTMEQTIQFKKLMRQEGWGDIQLQLDSKGNTKMYVEATRPWQPNSSNQTARSSATSPGLVPEKSPSTSLNT